MRYFEVVKDEFRKNPNVEIRLPERATKYSSGYDFYSPVDVIIQPQEMVMIWTDICCHMYHDNALLIIPRSSMGKHPIMISNTIGNIDADYADNETTGGNVGFRLFNLGTTPYEIKAGDKIGQGIFINYKTTKDDHTMTKRVGGYGSTDTN